MDPDERTSRFDGGPTGPWANLTVRVSDSGHRAALNGEIEGVNADWLLEQLIALVGPVDLDCSGLTFIDSRGIECLIRCHRFFEEHGWTLRLLGLPEMRRRGFDRMGLAELLVLDP